MKIDAALDDREPEPRAGPAADVVPATERHEERWQILRRDADAAVADRKHGVPTRTLDAEFHRRAGLGILYRVVEQVHENVPHESFVEPRDGQPRHGAAPDLAAVRGGRGDLVRDALAEPGEVMFLDVQLAHAALDLVEEQHLLHQRRHALHGVIDRLELLVALRGFEALEVVLEHFRRTEDHAERRAKLVRDRADEAALQHPDFLLRRERALDLLLRRRELPRARGNPAFEISVERAQFVLRAPPLDEQADLRTDRGEDLE